MHSLSRLRLDKVIETITRLRLRIFERFPGSGLVSWAGELERLSEAVDDQAEAIRRPIIWVWALVATSVVVLGSVIVLLARGVHIEGAPAWTELAQGIDAITSEVALLVGLIIFLASLQTRIRRGRVVAAVRNLRELAHIVDMLQLTKDPGGIAGVTLPVTAHSPRRELSPQELARYLDYCSEMLSLIAKLAQFYVADFDDPEAAEAVTDLEDLTDGLSRKIWQKIMILNQNSRPRNPETQSANTSCGLGLPGTEHSS
jgi:hypothetical protein